MALKYLYVPSGYKAGTAYGVLPNDSTADFDLFQRESTATRTNKDGLIELMSSNVPRIDYSDGGCPSLLLETQRTNKCRASEDVSVWGKNYSSTTVVNSNQVISPDGNKNAALVTTEVANGGVFSLSMTTVSNTYYSSSVYAKHISGESKVRFVITTNLHFGSGDKKITVDLSNGSIVSNELSGVAEAKVIDVGNGWYRLIIEDSNVVSGGGGSAKIAVYADSNSFSQFSVWGGQIEVGNYTSSYIPNSGTTEGSQTTKRGDAAKYAGNFEFNSTEGVLEARFKAVPIAIPTSRITLGATDSNRVTLGFLGGSNDPKPFLLIFSPSGDNEVGVSMPSSFNLFEYNTYKFKFQSGNNELKINGELVEIDNTFKTHTFLFDEALRNIGLNYYATSTSRVFYGGIQHIKVYDSVTDF